LLAITNITKTTAINHALITVEKDYSQGITKADIWILTKLFF
jgi:hypothetical protein